jgi:MFS transporter, PPP family, 3-phenylpropionic acid transporter
MPAVPYWRLSGYYFCYFGFVGAFSPYFGLYLQSLSFSAWDIGLLMSQMQLMRLIGPNLWGWLGERRARVPIVRFAAVVSLVGFSAFFWLQQLPGMLVAMAALALFWSGALPLVETVTFDHLYLQVGRYGKIRLWGSIGFIVAVQATGLLLDRVPPVGVVWACWLVLFGIAAFSFALPEPPARLTTDPSPPIATVLRQPRVRALLLACLMMSAAHGALYVFYSIHLTDHGYTKFSVGALWSLGVVAEIGVFMLMPAITRRWSLRAILLMSFATAVLRFLLIGWCIEWLPLVVFAQLLHGLTFGSYHAAAIAAINRWFPGRCQARGQALYSSMSFGAGGLLGGLVSGWTWDRIGGGWTYTLGAAFALLGLLLIWRWISVPDDAGAARA